MDQKSKNQYPLISASYFHISLQWVLSVGKHGKLPVNFRHH